MASRLLRSLVSRGESGLFYLLEVSKAPYSRPSRSPPRSLSSSAVLNRRGTLRTRLPAFSPTPMSSPRCTPLLAEPPPRGRRPHCQYRLRPRGPRRNISAVLPLERAFSASYLLLLSSGTALDPLSSPGQAPLPRTDLPYPTVNFSLVSIFFGLFSRQRPSLGLTRTEPKPHLRISLMVVTCMTAWRSSAEASGKCSFSKASL